MYTQITSPSSNGSHPVTVLRTLGVYSSLHSVYPDTLNECGVKRTVSRLGCSAGLCDDAKRWPTTVIGATETLYNGRLLYLPYSISCHLG